MMYKSYEYLRTLYSTKILVKPNVPRRVTFTPFNTTKNEKSNPLKELGIEIKIVKAWEKDCPNEEALLEKYTKPETFLQFPNAKRNNFYCSNLNIVEEIMECPDLLSEIKFPIKLNEDRIVTAAKIKRHYETFSRNT